MSGTTLDIDYSNLNETIHTVAMTPAGQHGSENWQLFLQSGRYFIRNHDYGAQLQLGLAEDNLSTLMLYPRSGSVSQQWVIDPVPGGWRLSNGIYGTATVLSLPSGGSTVPGMQREGAGETWNIISNPRYAIRH
jgi:hypothetical protein